MIDVQTLILYGYIDKIEKYLIQSKEEKQNPYKLRSLMMFKYITPVLFVLSLSFLPGCMESSGGSNIWASRASEEGKRNASRVSGYQHGEAVMICVSFDYYSGGKVATVRIKNAITGAQVYENSYFVKKDHTYFYTVRNLSKGSYIATVSSEGSIRGRTSFNID